VTDIFEDTFSDELMHEGVLRKSGRYPWGSGETPHQRNKLFLDHVDSLRQQGLSDVQIAKGLGYVDEDGKHHPFTTTQLRAARNIAKNDIKQTQISTARMLKEKGLSNEAIGIKLGGLNESSVRALLNPSTKAKADVLQTTANMLKDQIKRDGALDVGAQVHHLMGVSQNTLSNAIALLKEEGYDIHYQKVQQLGTGNETSLKILVPPGQTKKETYAMRLDIKPARAYSEDKGHTFEPILPPVSVSSKRLGIKYAEDGGADMDGVIQLRRGVSDISLGSAKYAQVRIKVDDTHYLKGMAMYGDNLPAGVDMVFNTNKSPTGNKLDALKKVKDDVENPFGATTRQKHYLDADGNRKLSPLNIVNEEGDWSKWGKTLSSQMLSKQTPALAKLQLAQTLALKKAEFDEINALTNPEVKRKLLQTFSDGADSAAVQLKAAGLPGTAQHVILPIPGMKDTEIYAPKYRDGEKVVLIRHPHGGTFEIPELTVNNRISAAQKVMKQARDAVGISPKVATQLSGADFDGDTVLVIPNKQSGPTRVNTSKPLAALKDFDPQRAYPAYEGMKPMTGKDKQKKMGDASNLITDMTVQGAPHAEIARAVRYSMVVIDAEKHNLNHKQARLDNGIAELKTKYQGGPRAGAATLVSRASSEARVNDRKARPADEGGAIDIKTGKKMFVDTGDTYVNKKGDTVPKTFKSTKMAETDDARELLSRNGGTVIEKVYAEHANQLKDLGNQARLSMINTKPIPYSSTAKTIYDPQVKRLKAALAIAQMNAPIERQAQLLANKVVTAKRQANPDMEPDEIKKLKGQELTKARLTVGAGKARIDISPDEWDAIQAGAITPTFLRNVLDNADLDKVKALATPRMATVMVPAKMARAKSMLASGYTQAEIAEALGVPASTLDSALFSEEN
jgi:hypothetical protein